MTDFAKHTADELFEAWRVTLWKVYAIPLMDRYGFTREHPNFTIDIEDNYVDTLPPYASPEAMAMQYAPEWGMSFVDVLAMPYAAFYRAVTIYKAIHYKRPWWTGQAGEDAYMYEKASNRRLTKPRGRQ